MTPETNKDLKTEIRAEFSCLILAAATGIVAAGSSIFTMEVMKIQIVKQIPVTGFFQLAALVGTTVVAGEIIGYYYPKDIDYAGKYLDSSEG